MESKDLPLCWLYVLQAPGLTGLLHNRVLNLLATSTEQCPVFRLQRADVLSWSPMRALPDLFLC